MGLAMVCDSCGKQMEPHEHGAVRFPAGANATVAPDSLDMCEACMANLAKDAKVKAAKVKATERRDAAMQRMAAAPPAP